MAVGIRVIYEPLGLVTGGVSGFAIVVEPWTSALFSGGIPVWISTAIINIPLFIAGIFVKGKGYIIRSFFAVIIFTLELGLIPQMDVAGEDLLMAAVCGGVLNGAGLGIVMTTMSSTGGTDLLGAIIRHFKPEYSVATIIFFIDTVIVVFGAAEFGLRKALYALIAVYITSKVMDGVSAGVRYSKMLFVITDNGNAIAGEIMKHINRGVTNAAVKGMYSGNNKHMLICIMSKKECIKALRIVNEIDEYAFVVITDAREVLGEGFLRTANYLD